MFGGLEQGIYGLLGFLLAVGGAVLLIAGLFGRCRPRVYPGVLLLYVALIIGAMSFFFGLIMDVTGFGLIVMGISEVEGDGPNNVELAPRTQEICRIVGGFTLVLGLFIVMMSVSV